MARYFFNIDNPLDPSSEPDTLGEELPSEEAAWKEATKVAGEMFKDIDGQLRPGQQWGLDVMDENLNQLFSIKISTAKAT